MFLKKIFLWAFLFVMPFFIYGQQITIQGVVSDSLHNPIANAVVLANPTQNVNAILAFANTNQNGEFLLKINKPTTDSLNLQINHISYQSLTLKLPFVSANKNFKLKSKVESLEDLVINFQKILTVKGDTLVYNVEGLKAEKDYTIEEVINRIPGITINNDGQIKYKDKAISHLYINGVDLLEERYNIATRGIPADAVKDIEVLTKHNHARIDIGRTESDNVSLNLKIKENQSLVFGSVKAEAGLPLLTGSLEATPIYIKDSFQNISSIKTNNIGKTLKKIPTNMVLNEGDFSSLKPNTMDFINPTNVFGVSISDKYWLNNDAYAFTNDALHKVNDSTLVKWNLNYVNELSKIETEARKTYVLGSDSTYVNSISKNKLRSQNFQAGINQEINKRNFYLKNKSAFNYADNQGIEKHQLNTNNVNAFYTKYHTQFSNATHLKTLVRNKNIFETGFLMHQNTQNEKLNVFPPVFTNSLGNHLNNINTQQKVNFKQLNLGWFGKYSFSFLGLNWNVSQDAQYNNFKLKTNLNQMPQIDTSLFPYASNFDFKKLETNTKLTSKWQYQKFSVSGSISANNTNLFTNQENQAQLKKNKSYLFIQPHLFFKYEFNTLWNAGLRLSSYNSVSDFGAIYPGVLLQNYSNINQNPDIINQFKTQSAIANISYSNIYKSFFANLKLQTHTNTSKITLSSEINDQGFATTQAINKPNTIKNNGLGIDLSKGILGTMNLGLKYNLNFSESQSYFNSQFIDAKNTTQNMEISFTWDDGKWYGLSYKSNIRYNTSKFNTNKINNVFAFNTLAIDFYVSSTTRLNVSADNMYTKTETSSGLNTLFNTEFYYKPSKKLFYKAAFTNILNTSYFTTTMSAANGFSTSQFSLRPRQFTIGLTYSL